MQRNIIFNDTKNNKINLKIELEQGKFSMSGDCGSSCGQCYDSIKPTKSQKKIIDIWKRYHLNNMNAGTEEQEKALKKCKSTDYDKQVTFLKKRRLYTVTLKDGIKYKYGTRWLTRKLPKDLWKEVNLICNKIEDEERERKKEFEGGKWEDLEKEIQAIGKYLEMSPKEAKENIEEYSSYNSNSYEAEGINYYVGTDEQIKEVCINYLTDDTCSYQYWIEEQIRIGNSSGIMNIDDWAEWVIDSDGYGHILNGWDGSEHYDSDLKLYVIRQ